MGEEVFAEVILHRDARRSVRAFVQTFEVCSLSVNRPNRRSKKGRKPMRKKGAAWKIVDAKLKMRNAKHAQPGGVAGVGRPLLAGKMSRMGKPGERRKWERGRSDGGMQQARRGRREGGRARSGLSFYANASGNPTCSCRFFKDHLVHALHRPHTLISVRTRAPARL